MPLWHVSSMCLVRATLLCRIFQSCRPICILMSIHFCRRPACTMVNYFGSRSITYLLYLVVLLARHGFGEIIKQGVSQHLSHGVSNMTLCHISSMCQVRATPLCRTFHFCRPICIFMPIHFCSRPACTTVNCFGSRSTIYLVRTTLFRQHKCHRPSHVETTVALPLLSLPASDAAI